MKDRFIPGRRWTDAEILALRTMCDEGSYASNVAEALHRNVTCVRVKCRELNLPLKKRFELYDAALIERIKLMASCGYNSTAIAKSIDRTPQSVRVKCVELGIRLRKPRADNVLYVSMDRETVEHLQAEAAARGTTANKLLRMLVAQIVADDLYSAVIDAPPAATRLAMWAHGLSSDVRRP